MTVGLCSMPRMRGGKKGRMWARWSPPIRGKVKGQVRGSVKALLLGGGGKQSGMFAEAFKGVPGWKGRRWRKPWGKTGEKKGGAGGWGCEEAWFRSSKHLRPSLRRRYEETRMSKNVLKGSRSWKILSKKLPRWLPLRLLIPAGSSRVAK